MYFRHFFTEVLIFTGVTTLVLWFLAVVITEFVAPHHEQLIADVKDLGFLLALPVLAAIFLVFKLDPLWITRLPFVSPRKD
jgi:hypothetical protein